MEEKTEKYYTVKLAEEYVELLGMYDELDEQSQRQIYALTEKLYKEKSSKQSEYCEIF